MWGPASPFALVDHSLPRQEVDAIYRVVAGVMHFQSLTWIADRGKACLNDEDMQWLSFISELWGVSPEQMFTHLTTTTSDIRGEVFTIQVSGMGPGTGTQGFRREQCCLLPPLGSKVCNWVV